MACAPNDALCIVQHCSGFTGGLAGNDLFNYWETHNCPAAFSLLLNTSQDGKLIYNPINQQKLQTYTSQLFKTYYRTNQITNNVTSPGYDSFQDTLLDLCRNPSLPGICDQFLTNFCTQQCSKTSSAKECRQFMNNNQVISSFCGCYVPPDPEYLKYTRGNQACIIGGPTCSSAGCTAGNTGCTGQPACDPLCHRAATVQKAHVPTGNIIRCPQNICVIDNVVVNSTRSNSTQGVNFNTVCGGCSSTSGCLCVVAGANVSETMANIGVGTNFNQFCGGSSVCIVQDVDGNIISQGPCQNINPDSAPVTTFYMPIIGIIIVVLVIVVIILFISIASRYDV